MVNLLGLKIFDTDNVDDYTNFLELGNGKYRVIDKPLHWSLDFLHNPDLHPNAKRLVKRLDVMFYDLAVGQVSFVFTLYPNTISDTAINDIARSIHSLLEREGLKRAVLVENKAYVNEIIHVRSKDL